MQRAGNGGGERDRLRLAHLHAREARPVMERTRERLDLLAQLAEPIDVSRRDSRGPQLEIGVDFERAVYRLAESVQRVDGGLVERHRRRVSRLRLGLRARPIQIGRGGRPDFPADRVMRQDLDALGRVLATARLDRAQHRGVEQATPLAQQALVRHLQREGVLERVLELREQAGLVKELGGL